jgi:hypothetical protein
MVSGVAPLKKYLLLSSEATETSATRRFEVITVATMKNAVSWDIKPYFVLHRRHNTSPLQNPAD